MRGGAYFDVLVIKQTHEALSPVTPMSITRSRRKANAEGENQPLTPGPFSRGEGCRTSSGGKILTWEVIDAVCHVFVVGTMHLAPYAPT